MAPLPDTPRRPASTRVRVSARPKSVTSVPLLEKSTPTNISSEPPRKKRKYIPGGPGGGGRYVDEDGNEVPVGGTGPGGYNYIGPRGRVGRENAARGIIPQVYHRRDRSSRNRTVAPRSEPPPMRFSSAAQAAAVVQSDGYKPREERAWEEFHPEMDIEAPLRAFSASEVEGVQEERPVTPGAQSVDDSMHHASKDGEGAKGKSDGVPTPAASLNGDSLVSVSIPGTPGGGKRRPGRPPKDPVAFFAAKAAKLGNGFSLGNINTTPKASRHFPLISNINAKEKLTLPQPSYRKTDTLARFEDKSLGLVRYVDKSMANVGYQESDIFQRPERSLIKVSDATADDDLDVASGAKADGEAVVAMAGGGVGRVEYDMDEQDDKWLHEYNKERKTTNFEPITREVFEITITKIEKEWHLLEKRIPKPNPKPPQTQRPRSSSAAAVNGEPQVGEEQDSRCTVCDDGDCENTNAIVFCDGCDLAVHQECYGVPFIPEGQWLCRKCQLIGSGIPTCIFCPNTEGAFKQTNASKWAHLLCAMWIPEVSLGNHTFMEPVMEVEKVPKSRWKLLCYICNQRMGACIQCGDKSCFDAFHVTCARRAGLYLKMKNSHGSLAILDGTTVLKAFCHRHGPKDYARENRVAETTQEAKLFYKKTMKGRLWADSQASALAMAVTHRHAVTEHHPDESQLAGAKLSLALIDSKKKGNQPTKPVWKLPSGAPVIPQVVFNSVEKSLQRFNIHKRKEYAADACRYWTLKREARRGAALLKRLQLQMETFSSMEITRRNWAGMGSAGRPRLARRIEFARSLIEDLKKLKALTNDVLAREAEKVRAVEIEEDFVDSTHFPIAKFLPSILEKALVLDIKSAFTTGLVKLQKKVEDRFYTTILPFVQDFSTVFRLGILTDPPPRPDTAVQRELEKSSPSKKAAVDMKERRRLAKRIIKAVQPQLEAAAKAEEEIAQKPSRELVQEVEQLLEACLESKDLTSIGDATSVSHIGDHEHDVEMADTDHAFINGDLMSGVAQGASGFDAHDSIIVDMTDIDAPGEEIDEEEAMVSAQDGTSISVTSISEVNGNISLTKASKFEHTPPESNGYTSQSQPGKAQRTPPTPPVSTSENNESVDALTQGGILWYLKDFSPDGTSAVEPPLVPISSADSGVEIPETSDDKGEDNGDETIVDVTTSASKGKKAAKPKKKARSRR